jgi:hypothetical protein
MIQILSLRPPTTSLSDNQHCYFKGSYGSRNTSRYISLSFRCPSLLVDWIGFPNTFHLLSILCYMAWTPPFLAFTVRGSQAQIVVSFVLASTRF